MRMWKVIFLCVLSCAMASHFRGALIQWRPLNTEQFDGKIEIFHRTAWRRDNCNAVNLGTQLLGSSGTLLVNNSGSISLQFYCAYFNMAENWETRSDIVVNTISSSAIYFEALFSSCCWISLSQGGGSWSIQTRGTLEPRPDNGRINTPPTTTITPIVRLQVGMTYNISIPNEDADQDIVRCRWATGNECAGVCRGLPESILNEKACVLTYTANTTGIFAVAIQIEDFITDNSTTPLSSIPTQFLIQISNSTTTVDAPQLIGDTPSNGSLYRVLIGETFRAQLVAHSGGEDVSIVAFVTSSLMGLTKSTVQHQVMNSTIYFVNVTWTPTISQPGEQHTFCFSAINSFGLESSQSCITLEDIGELTFNRITEECPTEQETEDIWVDVLHLLSLQFGVNPVGLARQFPALSCEQALSIHAENKDRLYWVKDEQLVQLQQCN